MTKTVMKKQKNDKTLMKNLKKKRTNEIEKPLINSMVKSNENPNVEKKEIMKTLKSKQKKQRIIQQCKKREDKNKTKINHCIKERSGRISPASESL